MSLGIVNASKVTVVYTCIYTIAMYYEIYVKLTTLRKYHLKGKVVNRYDCPELLSSDRLTANFREWTIPFLGPVFCLGLTDQLDDESNMSLKYAWTYVGLRGLYVLLVMKYGIHTGGINKPLWISTFPGYYCLTMLGWNALTNVLSL